MGSYGRGCYGSRSHDGDLMMGSYVRGSHDGDLMVAELMTGILW
jgi:hypothetical protein